MSVTAARLAGGGGRRIGLQTKKKTYQVLCHLNVMVSVHFFFEVKSLGACLREPELRSFIELRSIPTSWFKPKPPNFVRHEYRLQYLLECHIFGIMLTAMNSG